MQIGITNNLRKFLRYSQLLENDECDPFYCWDASREKIDGRIMLVLCNVSNRFCCVQAMRATDWHRFSHTCRELIAKGMSAAGFSDEAIHEYLEQAPHTSVGKTHGRKPLGCMNRAIDMLYAYGECDHNNQFQSELARFANEGIGHCATRKDYGVPVEWMKQDLLEHGIDPFNEGHSPSAVGESHSRADEQTDTRARHLTLVPDEVPRNRCVVCGKEPRVWFGSTPYCLSCYNKMVEHDIGAPHAQHDDSVLVAFDQQGRVVEFAVERMLMLHLASWTAREIITDEQRRDRAYEGIEVSLYADPFEDSDTTLARLSNRVQEVLDKPSTKQTSLPEALVAIGAQLESETYANETGWARICCDSTGKRYLVIDGRRYSADEFLRLKQL